MNIEDRIKRLEDVLAEAIYNTGYTEKLTKFRQAINEERIAEHKKSENLRVAAEYWNGLYDHWKKNKS